MLLHEGRSAVGLYLLRHDYWWAWEPTVTEVYWLWAVAKLRYGAEIAQVVQ